MRTNNHHGRAESGPRCSREPLAPTTVGRTLQTPFWIAQAALHTPFFANPPPQSKRVKLLFESPSVQKHAKY